ncbi:MAG TPA: putative phage tail protein [Bosea sp. (in: a-proteobacteria)]|uniref:YmfQ family protein n=1 Tax=Bosea sp. (in: a-proteobacteria) TaxID=1871050 RepID=UPI002DDC9318|nr:putative phage tail protein [Bosea sp. (in: a-proteobacteria)]HEV2556798.1 putative phage tail protein [Bosea sp. (in: a-proteobacteria)]
MSRSPDQVQADLLAHAPQGWVWPHLAPNAPDSTFETLFKPLAQGLAAVEATAEAMMEEIDPRTATLLLPDFERVLGPDPCGRDPSTMSLEQRRQLAHQRWTARGGASIPYFVALAAKRGVAITISENRVSYAGEMVCGDEIVEPPEQFIWTVHLALIGETLFEAGAGQAGDRLYDLILSDVECDIRRVKPAHTEVVFNYEEA